MGSRPWMLALTGWLVAAVLAGLLLANRPEGGQPEPPEPAPSPVPVNLMDPNYPLATAGDPGWDWHEQVKADLDGDGEAESVHVIARVQRMGPDPTADFAWDDGHPWQVYVEEPGGQRSHLYARWVQLGRLRLMVAEGQDALSLVLLEEQGAGLRVFQAEYQGPGKLAAVQLAAVQVLDRAAPSLPR